MNTQHARESWKTTVLGMALAVANAYRDGQIDVSDARTVVVSVLYIVFGYFAKG